MNVRETCRVGYFGLGDREIETVPVRQADRLQLEEDFTEEMSDAAVGLAASEIDDPFAEDGSIDERLAPERIDNMRMLVGESPHVFVRNEPNLARGHRAQRMIHQLYVQTVHIGNVARHVKRHYRSAAIGQGLVPAQKTFHDQTALGWPVTLPDNVLICRKVPHPDGQV